MHRYSLHQMQGHTDWLLYKKTEFYLLNNSYKIIIAKKFCLEIEHTDDKISLADEKVVLYYDVAQKSKVIILEIERCNTLSDIATFERIRVTYPQEILQAIFSTEDNLQLAPFDTFISFLANSKIIYTGIITAQLRNLLNEIEINTAWDATVSIKTSGLLFNILSASSHSCDALSTAIQKFECKFLINIDSQEKIIQAQQYMQVNISEPVTIKQLSKIVGMNECYLKKGFKELTGKTINEYFQEIRLEQALLLLKSKRMNVTEVSDYLGFASISHFSAVIKKYTGLKACEIIG
jgi:AraC-like DNA-binding protein